MRTFCPTRRPPPLDIRNKYSYPDADLNPIVNVRPLRKMYTPLLKELHLVLSIIKRLKIPLWMPAVWLKWTVFPNSKRQLYSGTNSHTKPNNKSPPWKHELDLQDETPLHDLLLYLQPNPEYYNTKIIRNNKLRDMTCQKYPMARVVLRYDVVQWYSTLKKILTRIIL